jgi:antitoxin component of MazEF toxin-antitoxin module
MKLQKQLSRKVGDTEYAKWVIVVPPETIKELDWKEGEELEAEIKDKKLTIKKV